MLSDGVLCHANKARNGSVLSSSAFSISLLAYLTADDEQLDDLQMVASAATIQLIRRAAEADDEYQMLRRQIALGWPNSPSDLPANLRPYATFADELAECGGLVFKGHRVMVPHDARAEILQRIHSSHIGVNGCLRRAKEAVYYPGITADIKRVVAACTICESLQQSMQKEPLMPHAAPNRVWEKVGVDIFTHRGQDYLITADYLSNYFEVDRLPSKRITDVIYALRQQFARHGIPMEVVTDNNPFNAAEFKAFAGRWEFTHTTSSPHYPQSNGKAESAVKQAKRLMEKALEDRADPFLALLAWRNTPSESTKLSPVQILFNRRTRNNLPMASSLLASAHDQTAHDALINSKQRQALYYDRTARERAPLPVGQTVRVRSNETDWREAAVTKVLPHRSYEVTFNDGTTRRRTSKHVKFSNSPPITVNYESDDALPPPAATATDVGTPPPSITTQRPVPTATTTSTQRPTAASPKPNTGAQAMDKQITTRSGRISRRPARFND